jgi:hypothetical protein
MIPAMNPIVGKFREYVIKLSNETESFRHKQWYVKYHLEIVEKIAHELCAKYPEADRDAVTLLVWLHDYGKIIDFDNQYTLTLSKGREALLEFGFDANMVDKMIRFAETLDKKEGLDGADVPIEVKIVSSADGAAHLIGPFFYMWWYENANKPFEQLMADNVFKANKDWNKKIVLPEIRKVFEERHNFLLEQAGAIPDTFL